MSDTASSEFGSRRCRPLTREPTGGRSQGSGLRKTRPPEPASATQGRQGRQPRPRTGDVYARRSALIDGWETRDQGPMGGYERGRRHHKKQISPTPAVGCKRSSRLFGFAHASTSVSSSPSLRHVPHLAIVLWGATFKLLSFGNRVFRAGHAASPARPARTSQMPRGDDHKPLPPQCLASACAHGIPAEKARRRRHCI